MKSFSISEIHNLKSNEEGFTLLELLIVIGIIAVLLAVAVVAINPGQQFAKVNNTRRTHDLQQIISAIQQNMIDNKGPFSCAGGNLPTNSTTCMGDPTQSSTEKCATYYNICGCLGPTYLPAMPFDPQHGYYKTCDDYNTQYTIQKASLIVGAPWTQLGETVNFTLPGEITVAIPLDNIPPTVGTTSPTSATVNVATTFSTLVSDNVEVTSCNLFADGIDQGSMTLSAPPCTNCTASKSYTFTSTGTFPMYAKCSDATGNITNGTSVNVNVTAPAVPDFSISANPVTIKAPQTGTSQSATITIASINNFNSAVNLSVTSGLPAGATANFNPNPVTPSPNGQINSDFIVTTSNVTAGIYNLTIQGQSGAITKTINVTLDVVDLSVVLTANPSSGTAPLNGVDLTATVSGSATGTINYKFDCTNDGTWELQVNNSNLNPYTAVDLCNYSTAGTFAAKVRAERDVANPAEATTTITVTSPITEYPVWQSCETGTLFCGFGAILACTPGGDPWNYSTGYKFTPNRSGEVRKLCGFFNGTKWVRLYNSAYNVLSSLQITNNGSSWACASITPVALTFGSVYYVVVELAGGGSCCRDSTGTVNLPKSCNNVTINAMAYQSPSGTFNNSHLERNNAMYGLVDIIFAY
jgi:prepilin-type N-terminal cleavage/methylation domain-containing protein